jgi:hypothetical protein
MRSGGIAGLGAGTVQAKASYDIQGILREQEKVHKGELLNRLDVVAKDTGDAEGSRVSGMMAKYRNKGGITQLMEDFKKGEGEFAGMTTEARDKDYGRLGREIKKYEGQVSADKEKAGGAAGAKTSIQDDMKEMLRQIKTLLDAGGAIPDALSKLARALT